MNGFYTGLMLGESDDLPTLSRRGWRIAAERAFDREARRISKEDREVVIYAKDEAKAQAKLTQILDAMTVVNGVEDIESRLHVFSTDPIARKKMSRTYGGDWIASGRQVYSDSILPSCLELVSKPG